MPHVTAPDKHLIHYRITGPDDAPWLMLSNSLGTSMGLWDRQMPALQRFRVLRYDTRGHGASDAPAGEYTLSMLGQDALALLDHLGIARTHFCGVSMGGAIGQWLAAAAPARIDRLVLANTAAQFGDPAGWSKRIEIVCRDGMTAVAPAVLDRWFTPEFRQRDPLETERIKAMLLATPPRGYTGCCAALRDINLTPDMGRIRTPTLVIGGSRDLATPPQAARALADGIAGARLVMIDAAHLCGVEAPEKFNAALEEFLR